MTPPDSPDPTARARTLVDRAHAVEADVDAAASELFRLGGNVAHAGTRREVALFGAKVAAEREMLGRLLDELTGIAASADQLDAELTRPLSNARILLGEVRRVVTAAGDRGRECVWIGDLATDRVRDFAEFDLLHSRASRHLELHDLDSADVALARLVALERVLLAPEAAEMLEELKFRILVARG